jgi:hypothetical protein
LAGPAFTGSSERGRRSHADPPRAATALSPTLAGTQSPRPFRARRRKVPTLWSATPRPSPLPAGRALVRRPSRDMAGSPWTPRPLTRPCGGNSVSDNTRRSRSGALGRRSDEQPVGEPARALSAVPHAARPTAPSGAAAGYIPMAAGSRRSIPRSVSGVGGAGTLFRQSAIHSKMIDETSSLGGCDHTSRADLYRESAESRHHRKADLYRADADLFRVLH